MSLPPSVGTFRIGGTIVHPNTGAPIRTGRVEFEYPYEVRATTDGVIVMPGQVSAVISDGLFLSPPLLDPHDPDITPQGYAYGVRIISDEWTPTPYQVEIPPGSANQTLALAVLGAALQAPSLTTYALASTVIPRATVTTKGDLVVGVGAAAVARLGVGSNGQVLTADSTADTGTKWATPSGGVSANGQGVTSVNGQEGPEVELGPADVGAAPEKHDHVTADILGLADYVDTRASARQRIVRVRDMTRTSPAYYDVPDTAGSWALFNTPGEYAIAAAIGDDLEVAYNALCSAANTWSLDLAVVTGATPTRQRYLVTATSTPSFEGNPANYTDGGGASFQGRSGTMGFTVAPSDIDEGQVRFRWVVKSAGATGRLYASAQYPLILSIRNSRAAA